MRWYGPAISIGLIALAGPSVSAQGPKAAASGWKALYPPDLGDFNTRAERAAAMVAMEEIERILWQIPELAHPQGFEVLKQVWGGTRQHRERGGLMQYSLRLWFFVPNRAVQPEGPICVAVHVNSSLPSGSNGEVDESGRLFNIETDIGELIPGATIVHEGLRWDTPTADRRGGAITFTSQGTIPWIPVTREEYLRAQIYSIEGKNGELEKEARKSLEKTDYERWLEGAAERKKIRDGAVAALARNQGQAAAEEFRKSQEETERQITEQMKAEEDEQRTRNKEALSNRLGDQLRAQIAAMTPAERASPARAGYGPGMLVGPDDPSGHRVLTPEPEFWRIRRSPAEVHAITIVFRPTLDCAAPAVREALWKAYQRRDWTAAFKRMVDRPW
jgi:hypothetical protein